MVFKVDERTALDDGAGYFPSRNAATGNLYRDEQSEADEQGN